MRSPGSASSNVLFMATLLGVGVALILGIGMHLAAGQGCEPGVEVRVFDAEPAELGERSFDLLTLGLADAGAGVAVRAAVRGSWGATASSPSW
jgi:hypothetical protein